MAEDQDRDIGKLVKRGDKRWAPEDLYIVGIDGDSDFSVLTQTERNRDLLAAVDIALIARAWSDPDQGGPKRAEEIASGRASDCGVASKVILDDARLALSLAAKMPMVQPVSVAPEGDKRLVVVDGRRRVMAARAANMLLVERGGRPLTVPIVINRGDSSILARSMSVANEQRRSNGVLARAEDARALSDAGIDPDTIMLDMGVSRASAYNLVALGRMLRRLSTDALALLRTGKVKPSKAYAIAKDDSLTPAEQSAAVLELAEQTRKPKAPALKPRVSALVAAVLSGDMDAAREAAAALPEFTPKEEEEAEPEV